MSTQFHFLLGTQILHDLAHPGLGGVLSYNLLKVGPQLKFCHIQVSHKKIQINF
jgi:hypothetical protein